MYNGQIVFAQLMTLVPRQVFDACVRRYPIDGAVIEALHAFWRRVQ